MEPQASFTGHGTSGRDEFVRVADIMGIKFSKGENWPHEMFDTLYDDVMRAIQGGEKGRYSELIKAIIQTIKEQIGALAGVSSSGQLVGVLEGIVGDLGAGTKASTYFPIANE